MDNSLQEIAGSFTFAGMKLKLFTATALAALLGMTLTPLPTNADPVCEGSECTITFEYTGDYQSFDIPPGAKNLRFDVQGARGGRFGGLGGQVTGSLGDLTGRLYVFVGGQGSEGSNRAGGFNGGGHSGGNHADEGSGGGASDIRTTLSLEDRMVVAGGGGGTGGWSGATGGAGGGLAGATGQSGQGGGGAGGTQASGGAPGSSNGGYVGSAGSFGQGGTGGFSSVSGGGGGGGGWFGGGGGGADVDTCCSDGGGGGGGSSYAYPLAQNVSHIQGFRSGDGLVVLSYSLVPEVTSFTLNQISSNSAAAEIVFSTSIDALPVTALKLNQSECSVEIFGSGATYQIELNECDSNLVGLEILPHSITNGSSGPSIGHSVELSLDQTAPEIKLGYGSGFSTTTSAILTGSILDAVNEPSEESFSVLGCEGLELISITPLQLRIFDCQQGEVSVVLAADSFWDQWGNSSPGDSSVYPIWIDSVGPEPRLSLVEGSSESALIAVSELPDNWEALVAIDLGTTACLVEYLNQFVSLSGCAPGQVSLSIRAETLADDYGNLGPVQPQFFVHEFVATIVAAPEPEVTLPPPAQSELDQSEPVSSAPEVVALEPIVETPVLAPEPQPSPETDRDDLVPPEPEAESLQPVEEPATAQVETDEVVEQATELSEIERPGTTVEQPNVDPIQSNSEVTDGVSLVQFGSGSEDQSERPGWLVFVLIVAFAAALVAGIIGYRLIGK